MAKHRRTRTRAGLLSGERPAHVRLVATVPCRDKRGRRAVIRIAACARGVIVTLDTTSTGGVVVAPLQAGRLRAAVRDALFVFDQSAKQTSRTKER